MIIRGICLLLLFANLGVMAWSMARPDQAPRIFRRTDPGVPALVLLRESDRALEEMTREFSPGAATVNASCYTLGPFTNTAELDSALELIADQIDSSQQRQVMSSETQGYWVYIPAVGSREEALTIARQLSEYGVRDYYVVTAGEQENTISLGLYRDQINAQRRLDTIQQLGFEVEQNVRSEEFPDYWLDYSHAENVRPGWEAILVSQPNVTRSQIACF